MAVIIIARYRNSPNKIPENIFRTIFLALFSFDRKQRKRIHVLVEINMIKQMALINDILKRNYDFIQIIATFIYFGLRLTSTNPDRKY